MGTSENKLITIFATWAEQGGMSCVVEEMNKLMAHRFPQAIETTFLRNDPKAYAAANKIPWPSITEKLHLINKPVLFMCGELADERTEMQDASKAILTSKICILPGLDHAQAYWYADKTVPHMLSFIETVIIEKC